MCVTRRQVHKRVRRSGLSSRDESAWMGHFSVVAAVGCKGKGKGAGTAVGSAAPPPVAIKVAIDAAVAVAAPPAIDAPPAAPVCFPANFDAVLDAFAADDHAATVCATNVDSNTSKCIAIDLATGQARDATRPADPPPPANGGYTIKDDGTDVSLCKGTSCTKLALSRLALDGSPLPDKPGVVVAPNGTVAVAPSPARRRRGPRLGCGLGRASPDWPGPLRHELGSADEGARRRGRGLPVNRGRALSRRRDLRTAAKCD